MHIKTRTIRKGFAALLLLCFSFPVSADYEIRVGASRNDNIFRSASGGVDETVATFGLVLDIEYESARLESRILSDLEYWHYVDDTFDNEFVGNFGADINLEIIPTFFDWVLEDDFGDVQTDPFQAATGANRETLNVLSTGPDFTVRLGSSFAIDLTGRYSMRNYEVTDADSTVTGGRVALVRAISANRSVSLNVSSDSISFDNTLANVDFDNRSAYLTLESKISRGTVSVSAGVSEIERNGVTTDGTLWGVALTRQLTARSTLDVGFNQRFSDSATGFGQFQNIAAATGSALLTAGVADPFENRTVYATWTTTSRQNQVDVSYLNNDEDYVTANTLDRNRQQLIFGFSRTLTSNWELGLTASLGRTKFDALAREDDDSSLRISLARKLSRTISVNVALQHTERNSDIVGFNYDENLVSVFFSYRR